jgi:peptide/nickel transport system substrate-binding protein
MMVVYGYSRLVGFNHKFELKPDILESVNVEEGRIFTLKLRPGHKWSDGHPFTTEDFRYYWEDVANNPDLSPVGPSIEMMVDGKPPKIDIIDATTIRYTWHRPNPGFLESLARPAPLFIYRPAHYLKKYHKKYADPAFLEKTLKEFGPRGWAPLHNRLDDMYRNENPDLPTLESFVMKTRPPSQRFVFERNPYYHRIDGHGTQLPYIDRIVMNIASAQLISLKAGSGESDLQARYLKFSDYTFLRKGAKQFGFEVKLWDTALGSNVAIFPSLTVKDPVYRALFREADFRRALSMAIDRDEINELLYVGLAQPSQNTVRPQSPLYRPEYASKWAKFDIKEANRLLDKVEIKLPDGKMGNIRRRDDQGIRILPDGRPLHILLEMSGEVAEESDVLQLVADTWKRVGIKLHLRARDRQDLRYRLYSGETQMTVDNGFENGVASATSSPAEFACLTQPTKWCSAWGQYRDTYGKSGEPIDMPSVQRMNELAEKWEMSSDPKEQEKIWQELLQIHADQVFTIGIVSGVQQPVVMSPRLRNVPDKGVYNWIPGAHFGVYRLDSFWLEGAR